MSDPLFHLPKETIQRVVGRLFDEVVSSLSGPKGVHIETALSGTAAMAGLYLLRAAKLPIDKLTPGSPVFSDAVNERGLGLIGFASEAAFLLEIPRGREWDAAIPPEHEPLKGVLDLTHLLESKFNAIFARENIEWDLRAKFCILGALDMLKQGEQILSADVGKAIIVRSAVAGSKSAPHPPG